MVHSLIPPRKKPLLNKFNNFCLIFVCAISIMVGIFAVVLQAQSFSMSQKSHLERQNFSQLKAQNALLAARLKERERDVALTERVISSNELLRQSINNLFDLVPDSIVLSEVIMEQKSLLLKGTTPTKEIFNTLLKTPLVSIFASSKTSFYQQKSGWFNFTSINTIENSEGFNE